MAKKADKPETEAADNVGCNDDQTELLVRHAAEEKRLQIKHSNERLVMLQRHAKERDSAKITLMSANGPMTTPPNPPRG